MIASRHWFVLEPLQIPAEFSSRFETAAGFEVAGNWYLAGEAYIALQSLSIPTLDPTIKAGLLARAASCFEISCNSRISARFYSEAAQEIASHCTKPQLAAELSNRAALQFQESSELFFAAAAWERAAEEFGKIPADVIVCSEGLTPLPMASTKSGLCGMCFEAAAAAYARAPGYEAHSVSAYWRAGKAYSNGGPNIQAFDAYRRCLIANIKYYGTLDVIKLRYSLPFSETERQSNLNPIDIMESALERINNHHHQRNPDTTPEAALSTNRQMIAAFHEFTLNLQNVGNEGEAGIFRAKKKDRQRRILSMQRNFVASAFYRL